MQIHVSADDTINQWTEFVDNIWDKKLPNLRDSTVDGTMLAYTPKTGKYGFEDTLGKVGDEVLLEDLDKISTDHADEAGVTSISATEENILEKRKHYA